MPTETPRRRSSRSTRRRALQSTGCGSSRSTTRSSRPAIESGGGSAPSRSFKGERKLVGTLRNTRRALAGPAGTWAFVGLVVVILAVLFIPRAASDPSFFLQILVYGLANGAIYALIALGYTMGYGIIELSNFAHGDVFTLGASASLPPHAAFSLAR